MPDTATESPAAGHTTAALEPSDTFAHRHLGPSEADIDQMLETVGFASLEAMIGATVPGNIRSGKPMELPGLPQAKTEQALLEELRGIAGENQVYRSMIGMGYHGTITPPVILRNILEDPRWYTPYTPYQAEISQGRLEALLNFQTVVSDLTGLELAGASLLDEATAAAEAMAMCFAVGRKKKKAFFVADDVHPQTLAVMRTRAESLGIDLHVGPVDTFDPEAEAFSHSGGLCGVLVQYPNTWGEVQDHSELIEKAHNEGGAMVVMAADLLSLTLLTPPGELGADVAVGSSQRFGVPMGYGGPHAGYFATHEKHARKMPGRLIGVSKDAHGNPAYRMAVQTREQHIKRDKATSNVCTAQVLLAVVAGMYAVYHGPEGLRRIALRVHLLTQVLRDGLEQAGVEVQNENFFDTLTVSVPDANQVLEAARDQGINLRPIDDQTVGISLDETTTQQDVEDVLQAVGQASRLSLAKGQTQGDERSLDQPEAGETLAPLAQSSHWRESGYLTHEVFSSHHSEHELLRYVNRLIDQDIGLHRSMIPLGSCTMKLNAAVEMLPITWPQFGALHPFAPANQAQGYRRVFDDLERWIKAMTGFDAVSLQPNAGSQGEYAGLMAIRKFHESHEDGKHAHRDVCLIPTSAHGTNPASAVTAGLRVVAIECREDGDIDLDDLRSKAEEHAEDLAALMLTYPSTHGVFESGGAEACKIVHDNGGLVFMDGANMNAQLGLTSPGQIGADVCHLNLHKTFCIPHGGGGPGMGPIASTKALEPFLPGHPCDPWNGQARFSGDGSESANAVSAAPYGSPSILPISWMFIALMRSEGLTRAAKVAILNANYMAKRLNEHFNVLYTGEANTVAHEFILDCRGFEDATGVGVEDIAKRLMDFGFHAPTMSWPVSGALMLEPTESEPKAELDRMCEAFAVIRREIAAIESGDLDQNDNPLKHAPHTAEAATSDHWPHPYPRQQAAYPASWQHTPGAKYWPPVARIDNPHGDRHLICTCPPVSELAES